MPPAAATRTLPAFNYGQPLRVVRLDDGRLAVVDSTDVSHAWIEHEWSSTRIAGIEHLPQVEVPPIPSQYGRWLKTSIGGVSKTVRRTGILRGKPSWRDPIALFAVRAPSATAVADALARIEGVTVGDSEHDAEYGHVTELVVYHPDYLARVAAVVARAGATPMLEDVRANAERDIGVERLDRIGAHVVREEEQEEDDQYGLRRGGENWRFPWMRSAGWTHAPITWDHVVANVRPEEDVAALAQPLRQHVARSRLAAGDFPPAGSRWRQEDTPPTTQEMAYVDDPSPPAPLRVVRVKSLHPELAAALGEGRCTLTDAEAREWWRDPPTRPTVVRAADGRWFRPVDTARALTRHIPTNKRWVSAALTAAQSRQNVTHFYYRCIEEGDDPEVCHAIDLMSEMYMRHGYSGRWLGKYVQNGMHVGNGDSFRRFARLQQYAPHRLPTEVLNRLCGRDGKLHNRGSKGSRSKYKNPKKRRYRPVRRMVRTTEDERLMAGDVEDE